MVKRPCGHNWVVQNGKAVEHECLRFEGHENEHVCYCGEEKPTERQKIREVDHV
jgi:hypothetical protein